MGSIYDHPNPSKQLRSDGMIVNPADGVYGDGSINVRVVSGGDGEGGSAPISVTLQNAAASPGNGTPFAPSDGNVTLTFTITGTSTSRTIAFELADQSAVVQKLTLSPAFIPLENEIRQQNRQNGVLLSWSF
ncbi:hypothetical protein [Paenibacillus glycinis]|uniref:Calx-beta domain-containing protein n=1 Tax=Paenibacillus glycinis TaxID=2697035 RepID=A0ABW9XMX2_9BACL|nr:hypothetical protein [Paenibacillus glycinis]NBD23759.1 hypothetical protein [Paenibacillus glycinis]